MSPHPCLSVSEQLILADEDNRAQEHQVYRDVSWEVHIESLGIHFTKGGG